MVYNVNISAISPQWQGHSLVQITHSACVWINWVNVFAFQFVLVQKMLFTDKEGGKEREEHINQVQFCNKTVTLTQLEVFARRLLPAATCHHQPLWLEYLAYVDMNQEVLKNRILDVLICHNYLLLMEDSLRYLSWWTFSQVPSSCKI